MYRKMIVALIVVSSLVIGYTSFIGSTAQAAPSCGSDSTALAANPELLKVGCSQVTVQTANVQPAFEAEAARYTAMAEYYLAQNETNVQRANAASAARYTGLAAYLAANPELMVASR